MVLIMNTKMVELWISRADGDIQFFDGKKKKPIKDEWGYPDTDFGPIFDFCESGFRQVFGVLGLRKGSIKRFRIIFEEIEDAH